jgi:hypothetical protein
MALFWKHVSVGFAFTNKPAENWYSHISKAVCEEYEDISVLWDHVYKHKQTFWPVGQTQ